MRAYLSGGWYLLLLWFFAHSLAAETIGVEPDLLPPEQAFPVKATLEGEQVRLEWHIAPGYYLYKNKFRFLSETPSVKLGSTAFPTAERKQDEFFGAVEIYRGPLVIHLPLQHAGSSPQLNLRLLSQGCADAGICYPPHLQQVNLTLPTTATQSAVIQANNPVITALRGETISPASLAGEDDFLAPEQAFRPEVALENQMVVVRWQIAPGYYLYRDKVGIMATHGAAVQLGALQLPPGEIKEDETFGKVAVFHNELIARVPYTLSRPGITQLDLELKYQGCAERGLCYPPQKQPVSLALTADGANTPTVVLATAPVTPPTVAAAQSEEEQISQILQQSNLAYTLLAFFGFGLLLSLTPCVFPMLPILSGIIVGQGAAMTTQRAFVFSLVYVLAMALTYTLAGIAAGLFGANLQAAFQDPRIIIAFSLIFVALSLSMFGFYDLQMPASIQSRLTQFSNAQQGGTLIGVAIMGFLSALIVGPCVAAPLTGALIYIGQTGDALLGGLALFALSMGMGVPLLIVGTSAGRWLPRAGGWMEATKAIFGVMMLGVAIWMLERIIPGEMTLALWAALCIVSAIYLNALDSLSPTASGWQKFWKGLGVILLAYGLMLLIGSALGGKDPMQPLGALAAREGSTAQAATPHLNFIRVRNPAEFEQELAAAQAQGQPVMLDFYADWCISCKEMERYTFAKPEVQQALAGFRLLQADVTANHADDQALLKRFGLFGPPSILFFGRNGQEQRALRVVGFKDAPAFITQIQQVQ